MQPKKKTDIIKVTSVFFAAQLQTEPAPERRAPPKEAGWGGPNGGDDPWGICDALSRAICLEPVIFYDLRRLFQHARD